MSEERTVSAYIEWFRGTFPAYAKVLDFIEDTVYHRIPRFSDYITELDVYELTLVLRALGVDDSKYTLRAGDANSGAVLEFYRALGDVLLVFRKKVEEDMKPYDPLYRGLKEILSLAKDVKNEEVSDYADIALSLD